MLLRILFFFFLFNSFSFAQSNWTLISEDKISDIVKKRQNDLRFYSVKKPTQSSGLIFVDLSVPVSNFLLTFVLLLC